MQTYDKEENLYIFNVFPFDLPLTVNSKENVVF